MSLSIVSFTESGMRLSKEIFESLEKDEVSIFTKCSSAKDANKVFTGQFIEQSIVDWTKKQMEEKNTLLFIGACGIAVRAIAPCITDKLHDSPVLVMDEKGEYIIPILSGHVGGANEIALKIALKTGAIPVVTTATDINGKFAVDLFAKKNGLYIVNKDGIAKVTSKILAGNKITMSLEGGHIKKEDRKPEEIQLISYPPKYPVDVVITTEERHFDALLCLRPKEYVIGMGCKKGKEAGKIEAFIQRKLEEAGISKERILALASIDRKREEACFLAWSRKENIPFWTFTAEQLQEVTGNFKASAFVKEQVGVDNVCERAALKACGRSGKLISEKCAEDGMTMAIAKREWRIVFDEE